MTRLLQTLCALALLMLTASGCASAQSGISLQDAMLTVCPVESASDQRPDFTAAECEETRFYRLDPQGRQLWAQTHFDLDADWIASPGPKGVYLSGLAASELYLNGVLIGANGAPGDSASTEIPGRIDYAAHAPRDLFIEGENTLTLRLSSHHGFLTLIAPMQGLFIAGFGSPTDRILQYYWPSLVMFGVFVLGALVFAAMAVKAEQREEPIILALLSALLGGQLLIEAARGLISYAYPIHDLRLIGIVACAFGVSLCLLALTLKRFTPLRFHHRVIALGIGALILMAPIILVRDFDGKTFCVLSLGLAACALICGYQGLKGQRQALIFAGGFALSALIAIITQSAFIDLHLYWLAGLFLIALFIQQALALLREQRIRASETRRAEALDTALALARQASDPATLQLESGGRTDFVRTQEIARIQAAGDYVELHYQDGRCVLYTLTLARLEADLPPSFLRVHRSHIVNTALVETLEREAGGGGRLILRSGAHVPVSRRILPRVRTALSDAAPTPSI
jgi:DNA-binding LytR/AlgR family response regulator